MQQRAPAGHQFDRLKPFYPLVTTYITTLLAFRDFAVRGMVGGPAYQRALESLVAPFAEGEVQDGRSPTVPAALRKLVGPLDLPCSIGPSRIVIDPDAVAQEAALRTVYLGRHMIVAAANLLVLAYERCQDEPYNDRGPLWEFLRHCRNGLAHGGKFELRGNEPSRLARWADLEITASLRGRPVLMDGSGDGLLQTGDPIRLLWDIEQAYPSIPRNPILR